MVTFTCSPEDAWEVLVTVSQHANVKLREVAQAITAAAAGEPMPAALPEHLASAVQTRRTPPDGIDRGAVGLNAECPPYDRQ
ncbi:ANTAR domain-containing protein [Streptomyces sp. R11]|uniref:ANTAR domain-containing protein n=1 Tax=Streptomyces sp. R11 TaxID=3238625 RepID=A0AB39NBC7_9ACTN